LTVAAESPVLLTGAAGRLGAILRPRLLAKYGSLRSTDRLPLTPLPNEAFCAGDLADPAAVTQAVEGCRTVVHFGARAHNDDVAEILHGNVVGTHHLFEAARQSGVTRIVFASSGHVVGFYPTNGNLDADAPHRPDSFYGVSKCFGEDLARLYWDKYGIECACLRIGVCGFGAADAAQAPIWLGEDDLWRMVEACLDAPLVGFTVLYGASDDANAPWHNGLAPHIGFAPQDKRAPATYPSGEAAKQRRGDPAALFIGAHFSAVDYRSPRKKH